MRERPSALLTFASLLATVAAFAIIAYGALFTLPSRQISRFPTFVQRWVIPETESAILPEAQPVGDTSALLGVATPTRLPTSIPVSEATTTESPTALPTDQPTPIPTETPIPIPTETPIPTPTPLPTSHRINTVTHHTQDWNNCGPATTAMALSIFDESLTQYDTASILKPNAEDRNVTPNEIANYTNQHTGQRALYRVNGSLDLLKQLIANDFPAIIEIGLDPPGEVAYLEWYGHYLLATGYDDAAQSFWVFDSLVWTAESLAKENSPEGKAYSYDELATYWPQFNNSYVVFYPPEREAELQAILDDDFDTITMWENTLEKAQAVASSEPDNGFAWFNLGSAYSALGQHESAALAFDKAREISLPWRMLWYQFGPYESYYQVGRYSDIILLANTTLNNRPYFEESYYYRGLAYQALGDNESARADFTAAAEFNPYSTPAQDALDALEN